MACLRSVCVSLCIWYCVWWALFWSPVLLSRRLRPLDAGTREEPEALPHGDLVLPSRILPDDGDRACPQRPDFCPVVPGPGHPSP